MKKTIFRIIALIYLVCDLSAELNFKGKGILQSDELQQILLLKRTPYEIGYQHDTIKKNLIQRKVERFINQKILPSKTQLSLNNFLILFPSLFLA
ncbi:hypothetical protein [Candidatus Protochlamydia amoebophila]|uniref:Uncharacterized protein n=1 Tax=Protochlamydia amoebophila (strain UWE25) TaxID=264201 RepID=Q6MCD8_PARUW|nr:hypothetical protein [Candidatus Protochlamydia amoebophila]CAF23761.1 unnamed protein product [Candidatus Protochlamydia amoebophila UWE25]